MSRIAPMLADSLDQWARLLPRLAELAEPLQKLADALWQCWQQGGKLLVAGNGGSSADAMHLAEELVVRFQANRRALPAIALCDPTVLTCAGNDMGFDHVFSRQIEALGRRGDVFLALSTSGQSANLVRALDQARQQGLLTAALLGRDGGAMKALCDIALVAPSDQTARIQEAHKLLFHTLCQWVDGRCAGG